MKKSLLNLAIGEFVALCVFAFLYQQSNLGLASLLAFLYLEFILLQGSMYWFYRYILIVRKKDSSKGAGSFLKVLRYLNIILLILAGAGIPIFKGSIKDLIFSIGIFLFGLVEYINYYWYRLSYGKSGFNIKILFSRGLRKSSINKLISRSEK